jgi:aminomethyltransferase
MVVANASNRAEVLKWLREHKENFSVEIEDVTESLCMLALQGPIAEQLLEPLTVGSLSSIKYYHFALLQIGGARALISRTGYTGEDGFEIYAERCISARSGERISISEARGVVLGGWGANPLRRSAMPRYGHE